MLNIVECACCQNQFDEMFDEPTKQAYGCASTVYGQEPEVLLVGSYGSTKIDMEVWKYEVPVEYTQGDTICDECIQYHMNNGSLVFYRNGYE